MITLSQLMTPTTEAEALAWLLERAQKLGFQATAWQVGSLQRNILQLVAAAYAAASANQAAFASGGYSSTAKGSWLTLLSREVYGNDRNQARAARHVVRLTCSALSGPYTQAAGSVIVGTAGDVTFRNVSAFTLPAGGTLEVEVDAEVPGAAGNVALNTITVLKTALAGVSVSNPARESGAGSIVIDGAEAESDAELHTRNVTKWATLGLPTALAYVHHCRNADVAIKRVRVDDSNPNGPGSLALYLAGDSGELSEITVQRARDYLNGLVDGISRRGMNASFSVSSARSRVVPVEGTVYFIAAYNTQANQRALIEAVNAMYRGLPIGGVGATPSARGKVPAGDLYRAILTIPGVRNYAPPAPLADLELAPEDVATAAFNLSYVSV